MSKCSSLTIRKHIFHEKNFFKKRKVNFTHLKNIKTKIWKTLKINLQKKTKKKTRFHVQLSFILFTRLNTFLMKRNVEITFR